MTQQKAHGKIQEAQVQAAQLKTAQQQGAEASQELKSAVEQLGLALTVEQRGAFAHAANGELGLTWLPGRRLYVYGVTAQQAAEVCQLARQLNASLWTPLAHGEEARLLASAAAQLGSECSEVDDMLCLKLIPSAQA